MRPATVESGPAALHMLLQALAAGDPFTLVLLDNHMPEMDGFTVAERIQQQPQLGGITIMMLSSATRVDDVSRCHQLGVNAYLIKPIRPTELLGTIQACLAEAALSSASTPLAPVNVLTNPVQLLRAPSEPAPVNSLALADVPLATVLPAQPRKLHILLVEDNPVNQRLALRLLEKRGHTVMIANDGSEALACFRREPFDVILMDVQLPDMNGYEATQAIRAQERGFSKRTPIIALTAHEMPGDSTEYLAAGLDGYVSKPLQAQELWQALNRLCPMPSEIAAAETGKETSPVRVASGLCLAND
jgi:two-component system, sensor histidine kinase and response regulator